MQKITLILIIILESAVGCSVIDKANRQQISIKQESSNILLETILNNNITNQKFFIEKAKVLITNKKNIKKFIFNLKFTEQEEYLISLRTNTGVEISRIYISNDSVLINDRINKELLFGQQKDFEQITGFPIKLLKICLGDFYYIREDKSNLINCNNNRAISESYYKGYSIKSVIDCNIKKVISTTIDNKVTKEEINLNYKKHRKNGNRIPVIVEIKDLNRDLVVIIKIVRLIESWDGNIQFIPGSHYEKKHLI